MDFIEEIAPASRAVEWDNVGLQVGSLSREVATVLLSLDMCPEVIDEAIEIKADLIITHHPLIFRPLNRIDYSTPPGNMIRRLIQNNITHIACHTNLDRSPQGTGKALGELLGLVDIQPFTHDPDDEMDMIITGRFDPVLTPKKLSALLREKLNNPSVRMAGNPDSICRVAVIPGSGGSFLSKLGKDFDLVITGDISYHDALSAKQRGQKILALGHYVSEKPVMHHLKTLIKNRFPDLTAAISNREGEPWGLEVRG